MAIKRISISNFKSFDNVDLELGQFNVFIGANASGKSNLVHAFRFLKDIPSYGVSNAISMQGGLQYLRNVKLGSSEDVSFTIEADLDWRRLGLPGDPAQEVHALLYSFALQSFPRRQHFRITKDQVAYKWPYVPRALKPQHGGMPQQKHGLMEMTISHIGSKLKYDRNVVGKIPSRYSDSFSYRRPKRFPARSLLLEPQKFLYDVPLFALSMHLSNFGIYDFDPRLAKKALPITGKMQLEEDGSNVAIVLRGILESERKKRTLTNLLRDILPFVDTVKVASFADKSLIVALREQFARDLLPASLISDGTINVLSLLVALYFQDAPLVIVEEPERNIHPSLLSKVVSFLQDASKTRQVVITTHNPLVVKHVPLENLFLVSRDDKGFSQVTKPVDQDAIRSFLQHEIGIDELYIQGLLN